MRCRPAIRKRTRSHRVRIKTTAERKASDDVKTLKAWNARIRLRTSGGRTLTTERRRSAGDPPADRPQSTEKTSAVALAVIGHGFPAEEVVHAGGPLRR